MTDAERDELIEKSLLNELDAASETRVQQLRQEDDLFRQEYDFQKMLVQQVRLKRRQELLNLFAEFEAEQESDANDQETPVVPLASAPEPALAVDDSPVVPLWQRTEFRVAAAVALVAFFAAALWWQLPQDSNKPIADTPKRDSVQTTPPGDTVQPKPITPLVIPEPQGPVAQRSDPPARLQGPVRLPYYETDDSRFGFGQQPKTTAYETVVFGIGTELSYEFSDTLHVYLPTLPTARPTWSLVYNRTADSYVLQRGKIKYEVIKGLPGRHPLTPIP